MRINPIKTFAPKAFSQKQNKPSFGIHFHNNSDELSWKLFQYWGKGKYIKLYNQLREQIENDPVLKTKDNMHCSLNVYYAEEPCSLIIHYQHNNQDHSIVDSRRMFDIDYFEKMMPKILKFLQEGAKEY